MVTDLRRDPNWSGAKAGGRHLAARGGPKHNQWPKAKMDVRRWIADVHGSARSVYEVFGAGGLGSDCWRHLGAAEIHGTPPGADAMDALAALGRWDYDIWDVDPYSNPFGAISLVGQRATAQQIGVFITDGCLRKMAQIRAHLPREVVQATGWDPSKWRKAWIYHHYVQAMREATQAVLSERYQIERMVVVKGRGSAAANYAGLVAVLR